MPNPICLLESASTRSAALFPLLHPVGAQQRFDGHSVQKYFGMSDIVLYWTNYIEHTKSGSVSVQTSVKFWQHDKRTVVVFI